MKIVERFVFLSAIAVTTTGISLLNTSSAQAAVLFDNGASNLQAVFPSNQNSPDFSLEAGDDFKLNSAANITKVTWSGIYLFDITPLIDNFSVRLFNIFDGAPDINPFATLNGSLSRVDSGLDVDPDATLYDYALTPTSPFSIGAGNYLLSIVNTTATPGDDWAWAINNFEGSNYYRVNSGDAWENVPTELSFRVEGNATAVPEPSSLLGLMGLGVIGVLLKLWGAAKNARLA